MSDKIEYRATAYKQSSDANSPWLVSFVAPAEELLSWAGIPRRSDSHLSGFQRTAEKSRIAKAKEYFEMSPLNQSPTALIVGIHPNVGDQSPLVTLSFDDGSAGSIRPCTLTIARSAISTSSDPDIVARIKCQLYDRLTDDAEDELDETEDIQDESEPIVTDEEEDDDREDVEIGRSVLKKFLERLDDPAWCASNVEHLREMAKPATIIDGQHRVLGADACERGIPFSVSAIFDCPWQEQIYQFTVINYTAKGIPDQFITANAALSLTGRELGMLEERLVQAGVKVIEYELMRVVNFDARSPFYEIVNLTEKSDASKIGYKTMVRVAKTWYDGKHNAILKKGILPNLYPDIKGKGVNQRRISAWKDNDWGDFFLAFWQEVRDSYQGKLNTDGNPLWSTSSNLLIAIVLYELQERFLLNLGSQNSSFFQTNNPTTAKEELLGKVREHAREIISSIPADFFAIEWKTKSLSTGAGRDLLKSTLRELTDSAGSFQYKRSRLVLGEE
jgi:hypothetical protein